MKLEQQFHQAQKLEALGRFAGSIAHDSRNLLTIIQVSAVLLEQQLSPGTAAVKDAARIVRTAQRAAELVQQLLRFSRREIVASRVLDLNDLVCEMEPLFRRLLPDTIRLDTPLGPELWRIEANPSHVEQVLMNLVINARDAMPDGGDLWI